MIRDNSLAGKIFDGFNILLMITIMIITAYPLLYVISASMSDPVQLAHHQGILLLPQGFTLRAYQLVLENPNISTGYKNTLIYVVGGTSINLFMTTLGAYVLSKKNMMWNNAIMFLIVFTMFFGGGMIPRFLLIRKLGMVNTRWALLIPNAIGTWNLIITRTSFMGIPNSLQESATIDGASDFTVLLRIILPLSLPVIAVMTLFYGVGHWNAWFDAMVFMRSRDLYPLQLFLREILIQNRADSMMINFDYVEGERYKELVKYSTIVVATVPVLFIYPFLQKYFVKGVMVGALKG